MSYTFLPNTRFRMPTHFGPAYGPRRVPAGTKLDHTQYPVATTVTYRFLSEAKALDALLPPGFELAGEPVVSLDLAYLTEIPWLAGRGYNMGLVSWPATFRGNTDVITGRFCAVLFENFADPILTGRDELGHPKIYCEIPPLLTTSSGCIARLAWDGYEFLRISIADLTPTVPAKRGADFPTAGWLQWKYIPGIPRTAEPDANYATHSPAPLAADIHAKMVIDQRRYGNGTVQRNHAKWEDMPTVFHIANGIADLPQVETRLAVVTKTHGWIGDVGDTRRLQ